MNRDAALQILRANVGFDDPEAWVDFAIQHEFKPVRATRIKVCPDCGSTPLPPFAQFIYYSSLCRLLECRACGLFFTDVRLDEARLTSHFDFAYKDEAYFEESRRAIFNHLSRLIDSLTPEHGRVLDVGGAKGHLMELLRVRRSDAEITVCDLSSEACDHARTVFGFPTIQGDIRSLTDQNRTWDVLVLSDVLYYEQRLGLFWEVLPRILSSGGAVVIRVPNKLLLTRVGVALRRMMHSARRGTLQSTVPFFNPEHMFILTREYLARRLAAVGCGRITVNPSPLPSRANKEVGVPAFGEWCRRAYFGFAEAIARLSGGRFIATPGMIVVGAEYLPPFR